MDWYKFKKFLSYQVGKPYRFGVENTPGDEAAKAWDCSELVESAFACIGIKVPDGSQAQFDASRSLRADEKPRLGCIRFFQKEGKVHHVGLFFTEKQVCEARGEPMNAVILRPMEKWDAWPEVTEWRVPLALDAAEAPKPIAGKA